MVSNLESAETDNLTSPPSAENKPDKSDRRSAAWDVQNAVPNYAVLVLAQAGSAFFSFASVWLVTRYLGAESYGGIVALVAASQTVQIFVNWTVYALVRFGVDEFVETGKIVQTFWLRLFFLLPNLLLVFGLSALWFPPLAQWLKLSGSIYWLVLLHFAASALWLHLQFGLQGAKMPKTQAVLVMLERLFIFAGLIALLAVGRLDAFSAMLCYSVVPLAMVLVGFWQLRGFIFGSFSFSQTALQNIINYSLPLLPFALIGYLSTGYFNAIFVVNFLSIKDLGIFSVATQISGIALQLPTLANSLLMPFFVTLRKETEASKTVRFFKHVVPSVTLVWGLLCTVASFVCYYAIPFVFGQEFTEAVKPFWILFTTTTFGLPVLLGYSAISNATSTTYISMYAAIVSAVANVAFNILLIPRYGLEGCAWATAIAYLISCAVFAVLLRRLDLISLSWTFQAMLPAFGGAITVSLTGNPVWSLLVCLALGSLILYLQRNSIKEIPHFLKNFRKS